MHSPTSSPTRRRRLTSLAVAAMIATVTLPSVAMAAPLIDPNDVRKAGGEQQELVDPNEAGDPSEVRKAGGEQHDLIDPNV